LWLRVELAKFLNKAMTAKITPLASELQIVIGNYMQAKNIFNYDFLHKKQPANCQLQPLFLQLQTTPPQYANALKQGTYQIDIQDIFNSTRIAWQAPSLARSTAATGQTTNNGQLPCCGSQPCPRQEKLIIYKTKVNPEQLPCSHKQWHLAGRFSATCFA